MNALHVTAHAAHHYIERVNGKLTLTEAIAALSTPAIQAAADFGAAFVRLGTGQRVVLDGHTVKTVLPAENYRRQIGRVGLSRYGNVSRKCGGAGE